MNIKLRSIIYRIKPLHKLLRVTMNNSGVFFYKRMYRQCQYAEVFDGLRGSRKGKRCFIIGNGPSLRTDDLERLMHEDCFASNGIYNLFDKTSWRPQYFMIVDRYIDLAPSKLAKLDVGTVFLGDYYWRFNEVQREDAICIHQHNMLFDNKIKVSEDISECVYNLGTVSFCLMQIAAYMGYSEMYLLGFDHNYKYVMEPDGMIKETNMSSPHFYVDARPEKEIVADVRAMTKAYEAFRDYANEHSITVKNVTRGGKLEVFERVDFDSLFDN